MLLKTCTHAFLIAVFILLPIPLQAQDAGHVPSGDLSDFFSPPGVPEETARSKTRSIGDGNLKSDSVLKKEELEAAIKAPEPPANPPSGSADVTTAADPDKKTDTLDMSVTEPAPASTQPGGRIELKTVEADDTDKVSIDLGEPTKTNWRVGIGVLAGDKPIQNMVCRIPVPVQWPEQTVSVFEENLPAAITDVGWEDLDNIRIMKFRIENVLPNEQMIASVTFAVTTSQILVPQNTSVFRVPTKRTKEIKGYYSDSPDITIRNTKLKKQAKLLFESTRSDWGKVEELYKWILENIEERAGDSTGSLDAFQNKTGTGEDRVSLFVAMCRINRVPARMVFVRGTQYAEFYLVDENEKGRWFPCKVTGIPEFGSISEPAVILQKGDNYRVPGEKQKLKFVPEKATWKGNRPKKMGFLREPLAVKP